MKKKKPEKNNICSVIKITPIQKLKNSYSLKFSKRLYKPEVLKIAASGWRGPGISMQAENKDFKVIKISTKEKTAVFKFLNHIFALNRSL